MGIFDHLLPAQTNPHHVCSEVPQEQDPNTKIKLSHTAKTPNPRSRDAWQEVWRMPGRRGHSWDAPIIPLGGAFLFVWTSVASLGILGGILWGSLRGVLPSGLLGRKLM